MLVVHPGAELYGSDRMLLESVRGIVAERGARDQVVVALPGDGPLAAELVRAGARVVQCPMPVLRKTALRPAGFARLVADGVRGLVPAVRLLRRHGRTGVYVSTLTIPLWLVLAALTRRPALCHVHEAERSAPRALRWALTVPLLLARTILVNSRYSLDTLTATVRGLGRRAEIVDNGVAGPGDVHPPRGALSGAVRLLYVGRLSPRKGPHVALAAARQLRADGVDLTVDLLGDTFAGYEWFAEELRAQADSAPLQGRVRFLGFEPDVWPRLAGADIVIIPSTIDEPFGNTAVEAVLAARPAVVSATSGLREAADGYASCRLVAPGDAAALAAGVAGIVADWSTSARLAETDAMRARDRHSPERYRRRIAAAVAALGSPR